MTSKVRGTYEWAVETVNCTIGCENFCQFCFGRRLAILRRDISSHSEWRTINGVRRNLKKENKKHNGTVMFPSVHDIHPSNLDLCIEVITNLLEAGNRILITSKPKLVCIEELCETFKEYRDRILFRFTIGTSNNQILKLWEPGAPSFEERFTCLAYAKAKGFKTSVSMEPMLDSKTVVRDAIYMLPFVTHNLWIGKMNKIEERVVGISREEKNRIHAGQEDCEVYRIYEALKDESKIRWKDSFKQILNIKSPAEKGLDK
jgi:DNA repair photolyase